MGAETLSITKIECSSSNAAKQTTQPPLDGSCPGVVILGSSFPCLLFLALCAAHCVGTSTG